MKANRLKSMLVLGTITSGLKFIGPFDDFEAAHAYGNRVFPKKKKNSWVIVTIFSPNIPDKQMEFIMSSALPAECDDH